MNNNAQEKLLYQFSANVRAYRRRVLWRYIPAIVLSVGATLALCAFTILTGVLLAVMALAVWAVVLLVKLGDRRTYTVYDSRIVFKRRNGVIKKSVEIDAVTDIKLSHAFYERSLGTETATFTVAEGKGGKKKYKMISVVGITPAIEYIRSKMKGNKV